MSRCRARRPAAARQQDRRQGGVPLAGAVQLLAELPRRGDDVLPAVTGAERNGERGRHVPP